MALYQRKTTLFQYPAIRLSNLLRANPQYGANETGIPRHLDDEPRYIRITDIDEYGLLKPEVGKTAEIVNPQYLLTNNDILLARSGATVGKSYIHKTGSISYPCFFAGYMIRFIVDTEKVLPDYVFAFTQLDTYYEWVSAIQRAAGQPNINAEEYKSLKIPIPPMAVQAEIVKRVNSAYATKKIKEAEAQRSLDSIDDYLLNELGINLPKAEENTLQNRIFYRNFSDISGGRFDPELALYNQEVFSSSFEIKPLKKLLLISPQYGANEPGIIRLNQNTPRYIRITDIDEMGDLIEEIGVTANIIEDQYILNPNDLLIARSGNTVGKSYLHKLETVNYKCFYAGYMIRFVINPDKASPDYIFYYLQSKPYKQWVKSVQRITGQPNINAEEYKSLLIPIPPIKKQLEIVDRITAIRNQAKQLRKEAEAELEQAKQEVEAMILGD